MFIYSFCTSGRAFVVVLAAGLAMIGCSEDSPVPFCENCEIWDQLTPGLARYPDPHPTRAGFYLYSTIDKTPQRDLNSDGDFDDEDESPTDSQREADEDLWLLFVSDPGDPAANASFQITDDANMDAFGDNFGARWSPGGTQVLYSHADASGDLQIWRVDVDIAGADATGGAISGVTVGAPELVLADGRDGEWITDTEIALTRDSKLFRLDLSGGSPLRGGADPVQLTFNPPVFASTETYLDRHPEIATDGGGVFSTVGRVPVGGLEVAAFELDGTMTPVPTDAYLALTPPGAVSQVYPLFQGADTLRTPAILTSLPLPNPTLPGSGELIQGRPVPTGPIEGNIFVVGARLDDKLDGELAIGVEFGLRSTYCDTTLFAWGNLGPGETIATSFLFEEARGTLHITTTEFLTQVDWARDDLALTLENDFPGTGSLVNAGDVAVYDCLLSWGLTGGHPDATSGLESYTITAFTDLGLVDTAIVTIAPGDTAFVTLFDGPGAGQRSRSAGRVARYSNRSRRPATEGASLGDWLRAEGDLSTLWSMDLPPGDPDSAALAELLGSTALIQHPALSRGLAGGVRYLAYVSDVDGDWDLYVQKLVMFAPEGDPVMIPTPGTLDNLSCSRTVFHPRFVGTPTTASVRIVVGLADCPDNGFEDLGFDDDPWSIGEVRLWEVTLTTLP